VISKNANEPEGLEEFLRQDQAKDLLRFTTAGSVDDGKSTLIGRLLYDSDSIYKDQLEAATKASIRRNSGLIDLSLITDGLRAEREQGITIDVAYRYFSTSRRKFIIADTPGHEQYTRNMVSGASTADLAIVLIDARKGLLEQSRRHFAIAGLLGLRYLVVAVNKMDLVGYDQHTFDKITADARAFLSPFRIELQFIPVSALNGDYIVRRSENMLWYGGPPLLEYLERVPIKRDAQDAPFRFAVQRVVRPTLDFRGYAGTVASGSVRCGDKVTVYPSCQTVVVRSLHTFGGDIERAAAGDAVTIIFATNLDISRGDLFAKDDPPPRVGKEIQANLVWLSHLPADVGKRYYIKHTTRQTVAMLQGINHRLDIGLLRREPASCLTVNEIGSVELRISTPMAGDLYADNRITGGFILVDPINYETVAAGMITAIRDRRDVALPVSLQERIARQGHNRAIIQLGGRVELARKLERKLFDRGCTVFLFDHAPAEVLQSLLKTGALILLTGSVTDGVSINAMGSSVDLAERGEDGSDEEILEIIERKLEENCILK
jgi:sulfate adenylyltransferase large subunit